MYSKIHKFWGDFGLTICFSVFWTMAFESPIIVLEKLLIGGNRMPAKDNKQSKSAESLKSTNGKT